jgi:hypothetical protein
MKNFNSASRIYTILQQASALPENGGTVNAWASLFQINEPHSAKLAIAVSEHLLWSNKELIILEAQLRASVLREELYVSALANLGQAFSTMYIATNWASVKQYLKQETLIPLAHWVDILPQEETPIQQQELEEILKQVEELEGCLRTSTLPEDLKLLITQHIISIRTAISQYPIAGARAIKEAAHNALGELIDVKETINENSNTNEVTSLLNVWKKANLIADIAIKGEKILRLANRSWTYLETLLPNLPTYPNSLPLAAT